MFVSHKDAILHQVNDKVVRRVLSYTDEMMLVEFTFQKGAVGEPHKHEEHEQVGYIARGSFEFTVGDSKQILKAGDTYYAAKNVWHGTVALEDDSVIVDVFTPARQDFLPK